MCWPSSPSPWRDTWQSAGLYMCFLSLILRGLFLCPLCAGLWQWWHLYLIFFLQGKGNAICWMVLPFPSKLLTHTSEASGGYTKSYLHTTFSSEIIKIIVLWSKAIINLIHWIWDVSTKTMTISSVRLRFWSNFF